MFELLWGRGEEEEGKRKEKQSLAVSERGENWGQQAPSGLLSGGKKSMRKKRGSWLLWVGLSRVGGRKKKKSWRRSRREKLELRRNGTLGVIDTTSFFQTSHSLSPPLFLLLSFSLFLSLHLEPSVLGKKVSENRKLNRPPLIYHCHETLSMLQKKERKEKAEGVNHVNRRKK